MAEQAGNLTFAMIKPDAVSAGKTGSIIQRILDGGFKIRALKLIHMTLQEAEGFYAVHRERPFFQGLTEFMSSGACAVLVRMVRETSSDSCHTMSCDAEFVADFSAARRSARARSG